MVENTQNTDNTTQITPNSDESELYKDDNSIAPAPNLNQFVTRNSYGANLSNFYFGRNIADGACARDSWGTLNKIFNDDQVFSAIQQRVTAASATEWVVTCDKEEDVEFIIDNLRQVKFEKKFEMMLKGALKYGFAVAEILWGYDGKRYIINTIKVHHQSNFQFDNAGNLLLNNQVMPKDKFWVFQYNQNEDTDFYGNGLLQICYWLVFFKTMSRAEWMQFLKWAGRPPLIGKYTADRDSQEDKQNLLDALASMQESSVSAIPQGAEVEILQNKISGTMDYNIMKIACDEAIAKIVLSQTMTTESGSSNAQSKTHQGVREDITKSDIEKLSGDFTSQILRPLAYWNGMGAVEFKREPAESDTQRSATKQAADILVTMDKINYKPSEQWLKEHLSGFEYDAEAANKKAMELKDVEDLDKEQLTQFASGGGNATIELANQLGDFLDVDIEKMLNTIKRTANDSDSLEQFSKNFLTQFSEMDEKEFADIMGGALLSANMVSYGDSKL